MSRVFLRKFAEAGNVVPLKAGDRCETRPKKGATTSLRCQIELFVIGLAVFPAAEQNAYPFESE